MRSIVGRKDVFLSYAHINIHFAEQIKVLWLAGMCGGFPVNMCLCIGLAESVE